jgi:hypothetical protein
MLRRKCYKFFLYIQINIILLVLIFVHAYFARSAAVPILQEKSELVSRYGLTDLCLFTDARYSRHPVMADLNTPFQDYPMSFEHFPSGSLMTPPRHLKSHATH